MQDPTSFDKAKYFLTNPSIAWIRQRKSCWQKMFSGHSWRGSLQMLLEKWSTSYLRSTMLKHKLHTAKLKITARNSLQSITPRLRNSRCASGGLEVQCIGSAELHLLHSRRHKGSSGSHGWLRPALNPRWHFSRFQATTATPPDWVQRNRRPRPTQAQLTDLTAPMGSAQMQNKPKTWYLFHQDSPCTVRNS